MKSKIILILILVLSAFLRLYRLVDFPAGFNADEAALGYNAYSLLLTGRDEHGHILPINLESFGDFKPAAYAYLLIPLVKVMGLSEFAVRLPSAIFGVLAVLFVYLLTKEFTSSLHPSPEFRRGDGGEVWGLLTALSLAISPWHLHFSRGGWEVNVATTLILIGVWSFTKWLKTSKFLYLGICILEFVLSMYFYQSARVIAPLLGIGLALLNFKELIRYPRLVTINVLFLLLLLFPLALSIFTSDATSRFSGVGLLADVGPWRRVEQLRGQHSDWNSPLSRILHNRPVIYTLQFIKNYTDHFSPGFLFFTGDVIQRNRIPETGLFYLSDFFFLAIGFVFLFKFQTSNFKLLALWLILAPIASALTFQTPHALRAHNLVIPMTIIISAGAYWLLKNCKLFGFCILVIGYSWQVSRYLHEYYVHYPQVYPAAWEYGFKELVPYVESIKDRYDKILVTDKYDQPYILFLFYSRYPPQNFQGNHDLTFRDKFNFSTVRDYAKYHFESTPWEKVRDNHSSLIVAAPEDIPEVGVNIVKTIYFPGGSPAFKIISN